MSWNRPLLSPESLRLPLHSLQSTKYVDGVKQVLSHIWRAEASLETWLKKDSLPGFLDPPPQH